jgi:hypothetical protein
MDLDSRVLELLQVAAARRRQGEVAPSHRAPEAARGSPEGGDDSPDRVIAGHGGARRGTCAVELLGDASGPLSATPVGAR